MTRRGAAAELDRLAADDPFDWRFDWYRGLAALVADRPGDARVAFDGVYGQLPGEPAARLALAAAVECTGDPDLAEQLYDRVWRVDHGFISAAFGLARLELAKGDRAAALRVLDQVPDSSSQHLAAQVAAVRANLPTEDRPAGAGELLAASGRLQRLGLDVERQARLTVEMLEAALSWVVAGNALPPDARLLGHRPTERGCGSGWNGPTGPWRSWRPTSRPGWRWSTGPTRSGRGPCCDRPRLRPGLRRARPGRRPG